MLWKEGSVDTLATFCGVATVVFGRFSFDREWVTSLGRGTLCMLVKGWMVTYVDTCVMLFSPFLLPHSPPPPLSLSHTHTHTLLCTHPPTSGGTGGRQVWDWLEAPSLHLGPEGSTRTGNYCTPGKIDVENFHRFHKFFWGNFYLWMRPICKKREAIGEHFYCEITTKYICLPLLWCRSLCGV